MTQDNIMADENEHSVSISPDGLGDAGNHTAIAASAAPDTMLRFSPNNIAPEIARRLERALEISENGLTPLTNLKKILGRLLEDPTNVVLKKMRKDVLIRMLHSEEILSELVPVLDYVGFELNVEGTIFELQRAIDGVRSNDIKNSQSDPSGKIIPINPFTTTVVSSDPNPTSVDDEKAPATEAASTTTSRKSAETQTVSTTSPVSIDLQDPSADSKLTAREKTDASGDHATENGIEVPLASSSQNETTENELPSALQEIENIANTENERMQTVSPMQAIVNWIEEREIASRDPEGFSFADVMHFVQNDIKLPGIQQVADDPAEAIPPAPSSTQRPKKPWELVVARSDIVNHDEHAVEVDSGD